MVTNSFAYWIVACTFVITLGGLLLKPACALVRWCPLVRDLSWWSRPDWVVVFLVVNATVFVGSLHNALAKTAATVSLPDVLFANLLIEAQLVFILGAIKLAVKGASFASGFVSVERNNKRRLVAILSLALLANALALMDSVEQCFTGSVSIYRFLLLWVWQNIGCLIFFGNLLVHVLADNFDFLNANAPGKLWIFMRINAQRPGRLWLLALSLLLLSIIDILVPV